MKNSILFRTLFLAQVVCLMNIQYIHPSLFHSIMSYSNLSLISICNCLEDAIQDYSNHFARRVDHEKNLSKLKEKHFKEQLKKIEKNDLSAPSDCQKICGYMGVSINIWNDESKKVLTEKVKKTNELAPQFRKSLAVFRIKQPITFIKYTPDQEVYDPFHYDLYKPDEFTVDTHLELIQIVDPNV